MSPSEQPKIAKHMLQSRRTNHDEDLEIERLLGTRHRRTCDSHRTSLECFKREGMITAVFDARKDR
jgi:hypothetical protein